MGTLLQVFFFFNFVNNFQDEVSLWLEAESVKYIAWSGGKFRSEDQEKAKPTHIKIKLTS